MSIRQVKNLVCGFVTVGNEVKNWVIQFAAAEINASFSSPDLAESPPTPRSKARKPYESDEIVVGLG